MRQRMAEVHCHRPVAMVIRGDDTDDVPACEVHATPLLVYGLGLYVSLTVFRVGEHSARRHCVWPFEDRSKARERLVAAERAEFGL